MATIDGLDVLGIEPESFRFNLRFNTLISQASAFSGVIDTMVLPGARWVATFSYGFMAERDKAEQVEAWIDRLEGQGGRVLMGHPRKRRSRGTLGTFSGPCLLAASVTNGARALPMSCAPGLTAKAGDMFELSGRLYRLNADATADGVGVMNLDFRPPLPAALPSGVTINFLRPRGTFVCSQPEIPIDYTNGGIAPFSIEFLEA